MDIKLTEEQADFIENPPNNKAILFYGKTCVLAELQPLLYMMFYIQI